MLDSAMMILWLDNRWKPFHLICDLGLALLSSELLLLLLSASY